MDKLAAKVDQSYLDSGYLTLDRICKFWMFQISRGQGEGESGPIECRLRVQPQMRSIDPSAFESESLHSLVKIEMAWMITIKHNRV